MPSASETVKILADKVEMWPIEDLVPYARNAKKHPPAQIAQIAASMRSFGFTIPILVAEDGTIIAGHGRVLAAKEIGLSEAPVIVAKGWTDEQRRAYTLADNKLAENAEWDEELLKIELGELRDEGFDIDFLGFDEKELARLLDGVEEKPRAQKVGNLSERFGLPPFTVLNAREGWWQERKRGWLALGIQSEVGRGGNLIGRSLHDRISQILSVHYSDVVKFIDEKRAAGLSDDEIEAEAVRVSGRAAKAAQAVVHG